jgi:hypothetical protein
LDVENYPGLSALKLFFDCPTRGVAPDYHRAALSALGLLEPAFAAVARELMRHIGDDPTASTHAIKEAVKVTLTVTSELSHGTSSTDKEGDLVG